MLPIFLVIPTKLIPETKKAASNIFGGGGYMQNPELKEGFAPPPAQKPTPHEIRLKALNSKEDPLHIYSKWADNHSRFYKYPRIVTFEEPMTRSSWKNSLTVYPSLEILVSPYRMQKPPRPENPRKLLKNHNLAHPEPVLKITEKLLRSVIKNYTS